MDILDKTTSFFTNKLLINVNSSNNISNNGKDKKKQIK